MLRSESKVVGAGAAPGWRVRSTAQREGMDMLLSLMLVAGASQMAVVHVNSREPRRPIATMAPYPAGMADDVRRPGFNGRLWVGRPIIGSMQQGPYPMG